MGFSFDFFFNFLSDVLSHFFLISCLSWCAIFLSDPFSDILSEFHARFCPFFVWFFWGAIFLCYLLPDFLCDLQRLFPLFSIFLNQCQILYPIWCPILYPDKTSDKRSDMMSFPMLSPIWYGMSDLLFDGRFHVRLISNLKSDLSGQHSGPQITLENQTKKKQKKIAIKSDKRSNMNTD